MGFNAKHNVYINIEYILQEFCWIFTVWRGVYSYATEGEIYKYTVYAFCHDQ